MKNDKYRQVRGGWSRMLNIACENCSEKVCSYQKDGPGPLKRLYLDRMNGPITNNESLICSKCKEILGIKMIYQKENRPAYRLFVGAVLKRTTKQV
ncbi:MAG TPA: hypothetical protein VLE93_03285 [Candidatus Saccharimonadales bacterium]|nr:hypothetical protein [Candidatus Saccharimonadales bacterium]